VALPVAAVDFDQFRQDDRLVADALCGLLRAEQGTRVGAVERVVGQRFAEQLDLALPGVAERDVLVSLAVAAGVPLGGAVAHEDERLHPGSIATKKGRLPKEAPRC